MSIKVHREIPCNHKIEIHINEIYIMNFKQIKKIMKTLESPLIEHSHI